MNIKDKIYSFWVNRNPDIARRYQTYRKNVHGRGRVKAWAYLLQLNIQSAIWGELGAEDIYYEHKKLTPGKSESELDHKIDPEKLAEKLMAYDIISFDIFDTLVFRPFSKPSDLFFMVGEKLGYPDFERIRTEIEQKTREKKKAERGITEVTFDDIWDVMESETGIPKDFGKRCEWECELQYCFANPYMKKVLEKISERGKTIIAVSDMYLGKEYLSELLARCGLHFIQDYYVSCDYGKSKSDGKLFGIIKQVYGSDAKYIHIGDNRFSDYEQAEKNGFTALLYKNVNELGERFRTNDMSAVTGSIYRGLINSYIYNGLRTYSLPYEFGFIYGGLFVLGYCQWIHEYVNDHMTEKILFLARDGDILSKVYKKLYPDEEKKVKYVYWSRLAATKMTAGYFKYDYFRRFLYHKVNQGYNLSEIFTSMEIDDMLEQFLEVSNNLKKYDEKTVLTEKVAEDVKAYLLLNWDKVIRHYTEQKRAGKEYYSEILKGCQCAVAVDVGWAGSGALTLNYLVNQEWGLNCRITGLIAGSNSAANHEPNASEIFFYDGSLASYMFSQEKNRDIWKKHNPNNGDNIVVELLLASEKKSFRGFSYRKEKYIFSDAVPEINAHEVQQGICDFICWYIERVGKRFHISGRDAYAPIRVVMENREWMKYIITAEKVQMNLE